MNILDFFNPFHEEFAMFTVPFLIVLLMCYFTRKKYGKIFYAFSIPTILPFLFSFFYVFSNFVNIDFSNWLIYCFVFYVLTIYLLNLIVCAIRKSKALPMVITLLLSCVLIYVHSPIFNDPFNSLITVLYIYLVYGYGIIVLLALIYRILKDKKTKSGSN